MINLEQVKLLDSKVAKAVDYVRRVTGENQRLETTLESYRKRIDELEVIMRRFKEDQGKIEEGILAALDRLNQFEDAIEKSIASPPASGKAVPVVSPVPPAPAANAAEPESVEDVEDSGGEEEIDLELRAIEEEEEEPEEEPGQKGGDAELDIF